MKITAKLLGAKDLCSDTQSPLSDYENRVHKPQAHTKRRHKAITGKNGWLPTPKRGTQRKRRLDLPGDGKMRKLILKAFPYTFLTPVLYTFKECFFSETNTRSIWARAQVGVQSLSSSSLKD